MSVLDDLQRLIQDPPPAHVFEISEAGVAMANLEGAPRLAFEPLEPGVLEVGPLHDNIKKTEHLTRAIEALAPVNGKRNRPAALILPDFAARVSVLDFDKFPSHEDEQLSLVRFRLKKALPFDIESAMVSFYPQPGRGSQVEVIASVVALEILARYEQVFRAAGFHPGSITTSTLAMLNLYSGAGTAVVAKKSGRILTISVMRDGTLKLIRCLEVAAGHEAEETAAALLPTFAFVEDQLGAPARRLVHCGFGGQPPGPSLPGLQVDALGSRYGTPGEYNAGLLGYLEGAA